MNVGPRKLWILSHLPLMMFILEIACGEINAGNVRFPAGMEVVNVRKVSDSVPVNNLNAADSIQKLIRKHIGKNKYLYFPNGVYLITKQIEWRDLGIVDTSNWSSGIHIIGESRDSTIFRVPANTYEFRSADASKAVFYMASQSGTFVGGHEKIGGGDSGFLNFISNLTIDIGTGNPGATGIDFVGNNVSGIRDVTIKISGAGETGVNMLRQYAGPGLIKNTSIEGFKYGIRIANAPSNMTMENITLKGQTTYGIYSQGGNLSIRKLTSVGSKPVIKNVKNEETPAFIALIDADITSLSAIAMENAIVNDGPGFFRNISVSRYQTAMHSNGSIVSGHTIGEFVTAGDNISNIAVQKPIFSNFASPPRSLGLPVEETPEYFDLDTTHWLSVKDSGAIPQLEKPFANSDQSSAINKALGSGKSTVYFPPGVYFVHNTLNIGASVKHIIGNGAVISPVSNSYFADSSNPKPLFHFGNSTNNVRIENLEIGKFSFASDTLYGMIIFKHASPKTLTLADIRLVPGDSSPVSHLANIHSAYEGAANCGKLFVENVFSSGLTGWKFSPGQHVWARQFDVEGAQATNIVNNGGTLWILGLKTENAQTLIETKKADSSGKTEVIGGRVFTNGNDSNTAPVNPAFINDESMVSLSYYQNSRDGAYFHKQIQEVRGGATRTLFRSGIYNWNWDGGGKKDSFVPLYVGYPATSPVRAPAKGLRLSEAKKKRYLTTMIESLISH